MKTKSTLVALTLGALGIASVSQAALVINLNPAATTVNRALTTDTTSVQEISFDLVTPLFNGSAAAGLKFYGGFNGTSAAINNASTVSISATTLSAFTTKSGSGTLTNRFFAFYDSADFLAPGNTQFDLTSGSSFSLTGNRTNAAGTSFVIRNGSQFYISQSTNTNGALTNYTLDGTTLAWAAFDPANWGGFQHGTTPGGLGVGASGSFTSQTFDDVTGVGYIFGAARVGTNTNVLQATDFQVNLVPEPSAALLGGLGALALLRRRRNA